MRISLPRLVATLPDAITSGVYLTAWVDPSIPGPATIKNLMLTMLIEFIVIHSSGFYAGIAAAGLDRAKGLALLGGLSAFYLLFIIVFAYAFDSTWPIFAFAWLFLCRFFHLWIRPAQSEEETLGSVGLWAASVATYVIGGIATVALPLPELGVTPDFVAAMHLPGSGEWVERPYTVLAFGTLYFAVQAFAKYKATPEAAAQVPRKATPA